MDRKRSVLYLSFLLLATLACATLQDAPEQAATATQVVTPTLAATVTVDPNAPTPAAGEPTLTDDATTTGAGEGTGSQTGTASAEATAEGGSAAGTEGAGSGSGGDSGASGGGQTVVAACPAGGTNLLLNPGFEGQYKPFGAIQELNHAPSWFPWWKDGESNLRPEFKPADIALAPNRVRDGSLAQQYFKSFGMFKAGVYQSVLNITPGTRLQFSAFGQAWSCEDFSQCQDASSFNPANMFMRVGIDPTGDTDWEAATIVWSPYFSPLDQWQVACAEAVAEFEIVTVFLWASPDSPRQNQDIYWDSASLVALP